MSKNAQDMKFSVPVAALVLRNVTTIERGFVLSCVRRVASVVRGMCGKRTASA